MYNKENIDTIFLPVLINRAQDPGNPEMDKILKDHPHVIILDQFSAQKKELFKIQNPGTRLSPADLDRLYEEWKKDKITENEGIWVYYPWSNRLIHILNEEEFVQLRTSRNQYKILPKEQLQLSGKKIGIIGLSVGHSVAISVATERICGKLKLADFDTIELSNLNRLKTGIHNIGLNKCIVTAREIAEIDPFLQIECYPKGITRENMADFLLDDGQLDILIDECDDLEIKIFCREMAKQSGIPVVMETSDRGMLDVERFDTDANRPILHGLLEGFPKERLTNISMQDRIPLLLRIVDAMNGSQRGRVSFLEVGQTITTWPQLASAVTLGGGVVTDVTRRILLNQFTDSGRYYVDLESIIKNKNKDESPTEYTNHNPPFDLGQAIRIADSLPYENPLVFPTEQDIEQIVEAGSRAPSSGNDQPWKWIYKNGRLHLFHDTLRSFSFVNYDHMAANLALGAAYENMILKSKQLGFVVKSQILPLGIESGLLAAVNFAKQEDQYLETLFDPDLVDYIYTRSTNRSKGLPTPLNDSEYASLQKAAESITGAKLHFITSRDVITDAGEIIGECDLITILNKHGHHDFFKRNVKWTSDESEKFNDGISVSALGNGPAQLAALSLIRDEKVADALREIDGGKLLVDNVRQAVATASCLAFLTFPEPTRKNYFLGGMALQRMWLRAEQLGFAVQPLLSPLLLFSRLDSGNSLRQDEVEKLNNLRERFRTITTLDENSAGIFLFKISKAEKHSVYTKRLPLDEILFVINDKI